MKDQGSIQLITDALINEIAAGARSSARLRLNHNFHTGPEDNPHRFLNVLLKGTYVTPHRHSSPPKSEGFLVLQGCAAVFTFHDSGAVDQIYLLTPDGKPSDLPLPLRDKPVARGIDLPPGVWHTVVALTPHVVCYEVKPGPWIPSTDKEFAAWAPAEGAAGAKEFMAALLDGRSVKNVTDN